jgi:alpha-tubulin suppressor-like RCC1 family protein
MNRAFGFLTAVALAAAAHSAGGQSITVAARLSPSTAVAPGAKLAVPLTLDMSNALGANVASLTVTVAWASARLNLDSIKAGSFGTVTSALGGGYTAAISVFSATGTTTTQTIATLYFTAAAATAGSHIDVLPTTAGNATGANVLSQVAGRGLDVCVAPQAPWGDANGDDAVNIIDAQQIARSSVGLSVANAATTAARGDVNADGAVNILDAQQIARFSVALSASVRLGTSLAVVPPAASIAIPEPTTTAVGIGRHLQLTGIPQDAAGTPLNGCFDISWSTSNASTASVNTTGLVTGENTGTATITATASGKSGTLDVTTFIPVAFVEIDRDTATVYMGEQLQLNAIADDGFNVSRAPLARTRSARATRLPLDRAIEWSTSDPTIATVSNTGLVTMKMVGEVKISASSEGVSDFATIQVSPRPENSLGTGDSHTCVLTVAGVPYCWGLNTSGQLGDGTAITSSVPVRAAVPANLRFMQIDAMGTRTCAVSTTHVAYCWGSIGINSVALSPTAASTTLNVQQVDNGFSHGCALDLGGVAYCVGLGARLGTGDTVSSNLPRPVAGGLTFKTIDASLFATCALTNAGAAYCWGDNVNFHGLGVAGIPANSLVPLPVVGGLTFTSIGIGNRLSCGVTTAGAGYCWGTSSWGTGGTGSVAGSQLQDTPTQIISPVVWKTLKPGEGNFSFTSACGLAIDGTAYCWGNNQTGQLGTTATLPNTCLLLPTTNVPCTGVPTAVTTNEKFSALSFGGQQVCGITMSHMVLCWGFNQSGQLGDGSVVDKNVPTLVSGGLRVP